MKSFVKQHLRQLAFIVILIGFSFSGRASHILGGEITWKCDPGGSGGYLFTLVLYRDCVGADLNSPTETINWAGGSFQVQFVSKTDVSPNCVPQGETKYMNCSPEEPFRGSIQKFVWRSSTPQMLSGTPPQTGLDFYWSSCCRPDSMPNHNSPFGSGSDGESFYLRAKMYPYTQPGQLLPNTIDICYDDSPQFQQDANAVTCSGKRFYFNHLASDNEQDSLIFAWAESLTTANVSFPYAAGYSYSQPLPNPSVAPRHGPMTFDKFAGEFSTLAVNPQEGWYATCMSIKAYKCGQLVAEVFRDVPIYFVNGCPTNEAPIAYIDTTVYTNIERNGNIYTVDVYPTDTVEFRLSAIDPDPGMQTVSFIAEGLQAPKPRNTYNYKNGIGCIGEAPCAVFTPAAGQTGLDGIQQNNIDFFWNPGCNHLASGVCGNASNRYYFTLKMADDRCPSRVGLSTLIVNVIAGESNPPKFKCVSFLKDNKTLRLEWLKPVLDTNLKFNYYRIYRSSNKNGPYTILDSISDIEVTSKEYSNLPANSFFYIDMITGGCSFVSRPSDTVRTIRMNMQALPPVSSAYAQLTWNTYKTPMPETSTGVYEVWAEIPSSSGNWTKVAETTDTDYLDTISVCNDWVTYQIRVQDTSANCYSASTLDSALFSDQINTDKIEIDSVSVNDNGNAIISWQPTTSGDVVKYLVLYNDPVQGWITIDELPVGSPQPYEWANSNADIKSESFKVISVDSCGNQSDDQVLLPVPTIYLRGKINSCDGYAQLSWTPYEGFKEGVAGYRIYMSTTDPSGVEGPYILQNVAGLSDTSFKRYDFEEDYVYCYKIQGFDSSGTVTSTSNIKCLDGNVAKTSEYLYLGTVTNSPEREALYLKVFLDGEADVDQYEIQRSLEEYGPWQTVSEVSKPNNAPYTFEFYDYSVQPELYDYYYRIVSGNTCNGIDTISNLGRNILLEVQPHANLVNELSWTPYEQWEQGVSQYDIYRKAEEEMSFTKIGSVNGTDTSYRDNVENLSVLEEGNYCYYVAATETANTYGFVMDNGQHFTSESNRVCMNQKVKMYMPTAFRPDSHIQENKSFGPNLEFDDISKYDFYVMNRWGTKVFESKDPTLRWDGTFNGEEAPSGVYVFYVKYATQGDKAQEERGTFTLVR